MQRSINDDFLFVTILIQKTPCAHFRGTPLFRINLIENLHTASGEDTVELLKRVELFKEQVQSLAH